jgi:hypothetical protein
MLIKVTLFGGYKGLIAARTLKAGLAQALRDEGASNVQRVELASEADVAWIRGMGGRIPTDSYPPGATP